MNLDIAKSASGLVEKEWNMSVIVAGFIVVPS